LLFSAQLKVGNLPTIISERIKPVLLLLIFMNNLKVHGAQFSQNLRN